MKKVYTVSYIGFGGMASHHLAQEKELPRIRVKGVFDVNPERMAAARRKGVMTYSSRQELLADPEVDIVLIAVPNYLHKAYAVEALKAGKHVLCEKPVTLSSDELLEIMKTAEETGKIFTIDQNRRMNKDFIAMKRVVESGYLGKIYEIESAVNGSRGVPAGWRTDPGQGGGMMLDWGVHLIDQLLHMHDAKVKDVYCRMYSIHYPKIDDNFQMTFSFEDGLVAHVEVSTNSFISHPRWYVSGTQGTLVIDGWDSKGQAIRCRSREDSWSAEIEKNAVGPSKTMAPRNRDSVEILPIYAPADVEDNLNPVYWQLVNALDGVAPLQITSQQALRVMRVMEAAFLSARENEVVKVCI